MKYMEDCQARTPLTVRYTEFGEDVEHYDRLIRPEPATTFITPSMVSPFPQPTRMKHTKHLTSSPYRKILDSRKHALEEQKKKRLFASEKNVKKDLFIQKRSLDQQK
ncbi:hypothetical protein LSAT2_030656, partial [Lamellibrachia satsuma]